MYHRSVQRAAISRMAPRRMGRMMAREAECVSGIGGGKDWRGVKEVRDGVVWGTIGWRLD